MAFIGVLGFLMILIILTILIGEVIARGKIPTPPGRWRYRWLTYGVVTFFTIADTLVIDALSAATCAQPIQWNDPRHAALRDELIANHNLPVEKAFLSNADVCTLECRKLLLGGKVKHIYTYFSDDVFSEDVWGNSSADKYSTNIKSTYRKYYLADSNDPLCDDYYQAVRTNQISHESSSQCIATERIDDTSSEYFDYGNNDIDYTGFVMNFHNTYSNKELELKLPEKFEYHAGFFHMPYHDVMIVQRKNNIPVAIRVVRLIKYMDTGPLMTFLRYFTIYGQDYLGIYCAFYMVPHESLVDTRSGYHDRLIPFYPATKFE